MTDTAGPQFVLGGYRNDTSPNYKGVRGPYWSSSASTSTTSAYLLYLRGTDSLVNPAADSVKRYGYSLRCLACPNQRNVKKYRNTYRLPTGNTTGEFQSLYNQYPTYDQMRKYPVGMVLGGRYSWIDGTLASHGTYGNYWSSSAYTSVSYAYGLGLLGTNNIAYPAGYNYKCIGFSLRCLAQNQTKNRPGPNKKTKQNNTTKQEGIPKSFRLPTGGPSGEYQTLYNNYNSYTAMTDTAGPHFVLGGRTEPGSSPLNQGTNGYYWSSSAYTSATHAYYLILYGTYSLVYPAYDDYEYRGFSLRCLAQ